MFTGLVETMGEVRSVESDAAGRTFVFSTPLARELTIGESIAINGACLTVINHDDDTFTVQAGPETLAKTNLGELAPGDRVNLERSLAVGERLGGHFVLGHVDGVGQIAEREEQGEWQMVAFSCPRELILQMVPKGSIAVDGVSLTLVEVEAERFTVMLIPHTLEHTTLGSKPVGGVVNLETDILAKHVLKLIQHIDLSRQ